MSELLARTWRLWCGAVLFLSAVFVGHQSAFGAEPKPTLVGESARVSFDREVRPILSNHCWKCHGPDAAERKGGLRLDQKEGLSRPGESGKVAVVAGKADESELVRRILSDDKDEQMPPASENKPLTAAQKEILKRWIAQGATVEQHWSFRTVQRPTLPKLKNAAWPKTPIDHFVLARLEEEGLQPMPEADRETLIRRVTLDLTGLTPTLAEVDEFVKDTNPKAYEKLVDRLLKSPHYGERMALEWLDAARFADTNGYHIDNGRDMTRWRKWVIDSFNRNLPFDQFTIQQLAGDLLPEPNDPVAAREIKIASGFNRNHMINFEGGAIPQEYHTAYIVDRVNTTSTVWLGLTVGCSQCHDHKYDPLTQREFYQLFAFFHNVPENGLDGRTGNASPLLKAPTIEEEARLKQLNDKILSIERQLSEPNEKLDAAQAEWEQSALTQPSNTWQVSSDAIIESAGKATLKRLDDGSFLASGANPAQETYTVTLAALPKSVTAIRLETLSDPSLPAKGPGRSPNGNFVLSEVVATLKTGDRTEPVTFKKATADFTQETFSVSGTINGKNENGWAIFPQSGKSHFAVFEFAQPVSLTDSAKLIVELRCRSQFAAHQPGRIRLSVTTSPNPHDAQSIPENVSKVLATVADKRSDAQRSDLRRYFRENVSDVTRSWTAELQQVRDERAALDKLIPTAMIMQEMAQPRDTFVLMRGQYDKPGEKVTANVPAVLPPLPEGAPKNRLGLAQWLTHPSHPLTSRVIVNRYWQMYFGTGLVRTSDDLGSQGELPSHPELLDWLAAEFLNVADASRVQDPSRTRDASTTTTSWDVKHLQRLIVTSATYRQQSRADSVLTAKDPENRLLAHGPRHRLPAEFIRDLALNVSGLLQHKIGGPSVSPYQPAGLWEELMARADGKNWTAQEYTQSHGPDLYRRTMYTFWKRTCPPAQLATFDAPDRETCTVRRARTNTPLQALVLMNDPTYVEASRKLAERIMLEGGESIEARITFAFRLATSRQPTAREQTVLRRLFDQQLTRFRADKAAALKLLSVGESARNESLAVEELAAWSTLASVILNMDETVTKG